MKAVLNQQLWEIVVLMQDLKLIKSNQEMISEWQNIAKRFEKITHGIQNQLWERVIKYDDLMNKHMMMVKELVTLKRASKSKASADK
jgi:hypothetical protein